MRKILLILLLVAVGSALVTSPALAHDMHIPNEPPIDGAIAAAADCVGGSAGGYPCNNVDLLSQLPLSTIGGGSGNDIWGWTDPQTGQEYAIVGRTNGTAFVDITNPTSPIYLGNLPTATTSSTWRDLKVYANHAYIVSEAGSHGLQVFDLTRLRSVSNPPVTFSADARNTSFGGAHNIAINTDSGYAYVVGSGTCSGGPRMFDLSNPTSPAFVGCVSGDGYTHDSQGVIYDGPHAAFRGREILFNSNEDTLTIVDVTSKASPVQLSRTGYAGRGYTHQGWLTEDHRYFLLDDETDETGNGHNTRTYVFDVSDLNSPVLLGHYTGPTAATDHNLYVLGDHVYQANYRAGLRILSLDNIANPASLAEVAYFDVHPESDTAGFAGAWSTYPYFDSGNVIVNSMQRGLFVLRPQLGTPPPPGDAVFVDDFESATGWVTDPDGTDTATTGQWQVANPQATSSGGTTLQLGTTTSGVNDLVTAAAAGGSVGANDIDNGDTTVRSPSISLPTGTGLSLTFNYYLGHLSNATSADYLRGFVVTGSGTTQIFEQLGAGVDRSAAWSGATVDLSGFAGQSIQLQFEAADAAGGSLIEAGIDDVKIVESGAPPSVVYSDDFESAGGWSINPDGTDTATTGLWERADPQATSFGGVSLQLGTTVSGSNDLVTGAVAGSSAGVNDIDNGHTTIRSPSINLPSGASLELAFSWYLAHLDNATSADYLRVFVITGSSTLVFEQLGAGVDRGAAWSSATVDLSGFAGQSIQLQIEAADAAGGSLIEAGIDDVVITAS